jgi:prophage maintenance system killer protein
MVHIAMAHAFVDGNKRTAVRSAEVFLELNGISIPGYTDYIHLADLLVSWIAAQHDQRPEIQSALICHVSSWMA